MAADDLLLAVEWPDGRTVSVSIEFKQPLDTVNLGLMDAPAPADEPALVGLSPGHLSSQKAFVAFLRKATRALADGEGVAAMAWSNQKADVYDLLELPVPPPRPYVVTV